MEWILGATSRPHARLSYREAYERIAAAGYTDLAVFANEKLVPVRSDSSQEEVAGVRRAAADSGLKPSMLIGRTRLELGLTKAVDDYKRLIDNAASLGVRWLLDCGTGKEEHYESYFELMRQAAPHAGQAGIGITLKPHGGITLTAEDMLAADEKVGHPAFGLCYDPGNIIYYTRGERRPETDVDRAAPRVTTAIIKDCVVEDGKPDVQVTAGDGLVDFPAVLKKLIEGGFAGPLYVECVGGREVAQIDRDLTFTLGYVKGILQTVGNR
jgi:sugar phosphate isomerase/epimerase